MMLFIKNMVTGYSKMLVKSEIENLGFHSTILELGEVEIDGVISGIKYDYLKTALQKYGFELVEDKKATLVEKIKNVIIDMIHFNEELPNIKFSCYLSQKLNYDYTYISNLFSEINGITIEHFIIAHKIERVKQLLLYGELTLTEISDKLLYSSVAHLSSQFKKVTGSTPTSFKKMPHKTLIALENL